MKVSAIIPARMASTRFPGKPLADILGIPMIEHVRRRVSLCPIFNDVIVATCDQEIFDIVSVNGGRAVMTSNTHERCTDRIAEAALKIDADVIVNVQGDEPLLRPEMFEPLITPLSEEEEILCTNLMAEIKDSNEFNNNNVVKTVVDRKGNAIYFSREPIPSRSKAGDYNYKRYKQLGIIAFRNEFLHYFTNLPQTPLEKIESVDMLRVIEHGYYIRMVETSVQVIGVDTPDDLDKAVDLMKKDDLRHMYM